MRKIIFILLFIINLNVNGQVPVFDTIYIDINQDGYIDTIFTKYVPLKDMQYKKSLFIKLNKKDNTYVIEEDYINHSLITYVKIPVELFEKQYNPLLKEFIFDFFSILNSEIKNNQIQWLINTFSSQYVYNCNNNEECLLLKFVKYNNKWDTIIDTNIQFKYFIQDEFLKEVLFNVLFDKNNLEINIKNYHIAVGMHNYFHYFRKIEILDKNLDYELLGTAHGIILKKEREFTWLFINESNLTKNIANVRLPTLNNAKFINNYIVALFSCSISLNFDIYIIDYHNETIYLLSQNIYNKNDNFSFPDFNIELNKIEEKVVISQSNNIFSFFVNKESINNEICKCNEKK